MVRAVVARQRVHAPVELEAAERDPIREAPDDRAEVRMRRVVARRIGKAEHDVRARDAKARQRRAARRERRLAAASIPEREVRQALPRLRAEAW